MVAAKRPSLRWTIVPKQSIGRKRLLHQSVDGFAMTEEKILINKQQDKNERRTINN
ncbi:MAG: hypothetical protein ACUVT3_07810 [Ignavibacterium sp.]